MRVLVVGHGAREHALCQLFAPRAEVWATRPNAGMAMCAAAVDADPCDAVAVVAAARRVAASVVVIGPEQPLALGVADALREDGFAVVGPGRAAAQLETSKAFGKAFCGRHGIATAPWSVWDDPDAAWSWAQAQPQPPVVKADGLAAGKGVVVPLDWQGCRVAIDTLLQQHGRIVLEQRLAGDEVSMLAAVCDGQWCLMPPCRDYKRAGDGDVGPMTGGMGAVCPPRGLSEAQWRALGGAIIAPAVKGLVAEGLPFRGVLYAAVMLTAHGPRVLEFNVRLGDPETQVLAALLQAQLADVLLWSAGCWAEQGSPPQLPWPDHAAATVVLAAAGYPQSHAVAVPLTGLDARRLERLPIGVGDVAIQAAGVASRDAALWTAGGRVLSVTAIGPNVATAADHAYHAARGISWPGQWMRRDIGRDCG